MRLEERQEKERNRREEEKMAGAAEAPRLHLLSQAQYHEDQYSKEHKEWRWLNFINRNDGVKQAEEAKVEIQSSLTGLTGSQLLDPPIGW